MVRISKGWSYNNCLIKSVNCTVKENKKNRHAGYAYSGPTAAYSYKYLKKYPPAEKLKVFILGPCHYVYIT